MKKQNIDTKIVRVEMQDTEVFDGESLLQTVYLLDPDMDNLNQIKKEVEARFDNENEEGDPSYGSLDDVEEKLKKHFTLLNLKRVEIMW